MVRERGERPENPVPPAAPPQVASPINWWRLDPEERAEVLEVLFAWVPELVRRYGLTDAWVPPCWYRHEAMVQELLALFQYRNQMQFLPTAPPSGPIDFHYQFQLVLQRLRSWKEISGCNSAEHVPTPVQEWAETTSPHHASWLVDADEYVASAQMDWADEKPEGSI